MSGLLIVLLIVVYGGLIGIGGLYWFIGWVSQDTKVSKAGYRAVFVGLCVDAILITARLLFDWVGWLAGKM